jgi:hypothetical protein
MNEKPEFDANRIEIMLFGISIERERIRNLLLNWDHDGLITREQAEMLVVALQVGETGLLDFNEDCDECMGAHGTEHGEHTYTCEFCGNGLATERIETKAGNEWWCEDCRIKYKDGV